MKRTKDRVREYRRKHPNASLREIQKALGMSSPSVVKFHIDHDAKQDKLKMLRDALSDCARQLAHCLGPDTEAGRKAAAALKATR